MNNRVLEKLFKIAENQQKVIIKLSQLSDDIKYLEAFIKSSVSLYLVSNNIFAKENHVLELIDPNQFKVTITLTPATKMPLSESVINDLKSFLTTKIQSNPTLRSKSIDLDVKTTL